jgi:hypothetical protein
MFGENIVSWTKRSTDVERPIISSLRIAGRSSYLLPDWVSWPLSTLRRDGRSETELGAKAISRRASGLSGLIAVNLNPATPYFEVESFG